MKAPYRIARRIARLHYGNDDVQIADDAPISCVGGGRSCWVEARIWVSDADFADYNADFADYNLEAACCWCGYPLDVGDKAYPTRYEDPCCSPKCRDRLEHHVELDGEGQL